MLDLPTNQELSGTHTDLTGEDPMQDYCAAKLIQNSLRLTELHACVEFCLSRLEEAVYLS